MRWTTIQFVYPGFARAEHCKTEMLRHWANVTDTEGLENWWVFCVTDCCCTLTWAILHDDVNSSQRAVTALLYKALLWTPKSITPSTTQSFSDLRRIADVFVNNPIVYICVVIMVHWRMQWPKLTSTQFWIDEWRGRNIIKASRFDYNLLSQFHSQQHASTHTQTSIQRYRCGRIKQLSTYALQPAATSLLWSRALARLHMSSDRSTA